MSIIPEQNLVLYGGTTTLSWSVHAGFSLECEVLGPGVSSGQFDPKDTFDLTGGPHEASVHTAKLYAASSYQLSCYEPVTQQTFTLPAEVEVIPRPFET